MSLSNGTHGARAIVSVAAETACQRCAAGKGCGAGLITGAGGDRRVEATIRPGLDIAENDIVEISLAPDNLLRAAAIVYGLPMLGAVAAAAIAYAFSLGDAAAALAALGGLACGLAVSRWRLQQTSCLRRFVPSVQARLSAGDAVTR